MPRRSILTCAASAALAVALTGCSSGVSHPIVGVSPKHILLPSPGSSASALIVESSDTVLRTHLLTLADLPSGWKNVTGAAGIVDAGCEGISDPAYNRLPLHVEAEFATSSGAPRLTETLAYGTTAQVDAAWSDYEQGVDSCDHLTQMSFPRTGDATDARQVVTTQGRPASTFFVLIRKGNLLEALAYSDPGTPSTSEVQRLVERADAATAEIR